MRILPRIDRPNLQSLNNYQTNAVKQFQLAIARTQAEVDRLQGRSQCILGYLIKLWFQIKMFATKGG
ncbi:MAG: hypothetical protein HC849_11085 [Oscillatoriales cyanobacterium RU_3_3]|nr:hypothetical protein [Microcoleus sp. SU_5_6]NJL68574.1 hypothetical protein [Microcoleus sp. SM1_3_4]NJM60616.1 hypothetical protein [Oscillatoriales cyanobacterium RU_3_3]NJR20879.1 hypothetical protein [Richelia sp. CSU_2_1]